MAIDLRGPIAERSGPYLDLRTAAPGPRGVQLSLQSATASPLVPAAPVQNVDITNETAGETPPANPPPATKDPNAPPGGYIKGVAYPVPGAPDKKRIYDEWPSGNPKWGNAFTDTTAAAAVPKTPRVDSPAQTTSANAAAQNAQTAAERAAAQAAQDKLDSEYRDAVQKWKEATDSRDFDAANYWKEKAYGIQVQQQGLAEKTQRDRNAIDQGNLAVSQGQLAVSQGQLGNQTAQTVGFTADGKPVLATMNALGYVTMPDGRVLSTLDREVQEAISRREDMKANLTRQQQAFNQEQTRREEAVKLGLNPVNYLEYAALHSGRPVDPNTTLGAALSKIKTTPDVETFLTPPAPATAATPGTQQPGAQQPGAQPNPATAALGNAGQVAAAAAPGAFAPTPSQEPLTNAGNVAAAAAPTSFAMPPPNINVKPLPDSADAGRTPDIYVRPAPGSEYGAVTQPYGAGTGAGALDLSGGAQFPTYAPTPGLSPALQIGGNGGYQLQSMQPGSISNTTPQDVAGMAAAATGPGSYTHSEIPSTGPRFGNAAPTTPAAPSPYPGGRQSGALTYSEARGLTGGTLPGNLEGAYSRAMPRVGQFAFRPIGGVPMIAPQSRATLGAADRQAEVGLLQSTGNSLNQDTSDILNINRRGPGLSIAGAPNRKVGVA